MIQIKLSVAVRVPLRALDSTGVAVTGLVAADVTATLYYADGTSSAVTESGNWYELAAGAYQLNITPGVLGPVVLVAVMAGANDFVGVYDCVADFASDAVTAGNDAETEAALATAAATTAASSAATAATAAGAASTSSSGAVTAANAASVAATAALDALTGGWTLDPVLNQLVMYSTDNVTVIATFNCFDSSGTPSVTNVYRRVKV